MPAMLLPVVDADTTRAQIDEALTSLAHEAGRMLRYDGLGRPNASWIRWHRAMDELLTAREDRL